jgi:hypothetical protein
MRRNPSLVLVVVFTAACFQSRTPIDYVVPANYRGWVEVEFNRSSCGSTRDASGRLIIRVSAQGKGCTDMKFESGAARDRYILGSESTTHEITVGQPSFGGLVWGPEYAGKSPDGRQRGEYYRFFVGSEAEFKKYLEAGEPRDLTPQHHRPTRTQ